MREGILVRSSHNLRQHMTEQDRPLTAREISDLLDLSQSFTYNVLIYMEALGMIDRVKSGRKHLYYLKGSYDEDHLATFLSDANSSSSDGSTMSSTPAQSPAPSTSEDLLPALAILGIDVAEEVEPEPRAEPYIDEEVTGPEEAVPGTSLQIKVVRLGRVKYLPGYAVLLTKGDTRYLKENYLKGLDGYERIEEFDTFFAHRWALEKRMYGSIFYICRGAPNSWKKIYMVTLLNRYGIEMNSVKFGLKPLKEVPKGGRRGGSMYDPILEQFLESGHEIVQVTVEDKKLPTVRTTLAKRIEKKELEDKIEVGFRGGVLYLRKL